MSDDKSAEPAPKKKGGLVKKLILFGMLPALLIGGGIGAGLYVAGGTKATAAHEDPDRPKLLVKEGAHAPKGGHEPAVPDPAIYKSTYYPIEQPFTSNLHDTDSFLQMALGVSTFYDGKVIDHLKDSEMPVRSAVLEVLAEQDAEALNTPRGKAALRTALKGKINDVLKRRTGFGGIDDVYFTSFIVQ